jgi:membrane protein DedA with SNARE-associated domain
MDAMQPVLEFLLKYGYWVLFLNVLAEQLAIPLPAGPVLLAMGALAGLGHFSFSVALLLGVLACLICDQIWYKLGRTRGQSILRLICRISLEPDSCVSSTKSTFAKWGAWSLVFSKFVPGLSAVAAPMAGLTRMPLHKFLLADAAGSLIWTGSYLLLGFLFHNQLEDVAASLARFGGRLLIAAVLALAAYILYKVYDRRRFLKNLRVARITPEELNDMLQSNQPVAIIDLRHRLEVEYDTVRIPGALSITLEEIEARKDEIPRDQEVILYCS